MIQRSKASKNIYLHTMIGFKIVAWQYIRNRDIEHALHSASNYRKEKSIKRAVYQNYTSQVKNQKTFDASFIKACTGNIKDTNIVVALLNLKLEVLNRGRMEKNAPSLFIQFLKEYYTEKQILKLFKHIDLSANVHLFNDTLRVLYDDIDVIKPNFKKVRCALGTVHNEFVRCANKETDLKLFKQKLAYTNQKLSSCSRVHHYDVKLPHNRKELYYWADRLHNCLDEYFDMIKTHEITVYGFFKEDVLAFVIMMCDNYVIESARKYNQTLTDLEKVSLEQWVKTNNFNKSNKVKVFWDRLVFFIT